MNKENEYEFIIHKHGLESRFVFTQCERIVLTEEEFKAIILFLNSCKDLWEAHTLNKSTYIKNLIDKLKSLFEKSDPKLVRINPSNDVGYGTKAPSLTSVKSEPEPAPSGRLLSSDALEDDSL